MPDRISRTAIIVRTTMVATAMIACPALSQDSSLPDAGSPNAPSLPDNRVEAALAVFSQWVAAFRAGEYEAQWQLVDPRMRYWVKKDRYVKQMRLSARKRGDIEDYSIYAAFPVAAEQIPCTEQRHCFRKGVEYVMFMIHSRYKGRNQPPQPEFAVMSLSEEGWRYGGGTFPYRPMGETSVLLDEVDEARYRRYKQDRQSAAN